MKKKNILYTVGLAFTMAASLTSCDDYLDTMPDNRTQVDSEEKVVRLLTSAYSGNTTLVMAECSSDNVDDMGSRYSNYTSRFYDQLYSWQVLTEQDNDGPYFVWQEFYKAVAAANHALEAIEEMGGPTTQTLREAKAEALLCRAYSHYMLSYLFCLPYNPATCASDLGLTYMTKSETKLNVDYPRESMKSYYEKIDKDIQEALPMVGDTHLNVPKYHFNRQAAYAFAAHFYLDYQQWDKVVKYSTEALGSAPSTMLRDWDEMSNTAVPSDISPRTNLYIDASANSNLMLMTATSNAGFWVSNWLIGNRKYSHCTYLAETEDLMSTNIWGSYQLMRCQPMQAVAGAFDRVFVCKLPMMENWQDASHTTYLACTVYPAFKADLTLLERAEAYTMLKDYESACSDLTLWMQNWTKSKMTLTPENIKKYYDGMDYWTWDKPTQKKHLHPLFQWDGEGSTQESMLQCVLNFKRLETIYEGYRWFDVKRYGITIYRRTMNAAGEPESVSDSLTVNDPRRALQLPQEVMAAGYQPNPR